LLPADASAGLADGGWVAAGAGWTRYPGLAAANAGPIAGTSELRYPRARYLLGLGVRAWRTGADIAPDALEPAYLRLAVAAGPRPGED
ncbi:MAG: hypothetical protein ACREQZ_02650, partial [Woeseiaceae bacterium]